eukprot:GEZU01029574.1.p2 GENE.GEZU01029574.1~~GEZU01029574.1.p2  ORF type:complete len:241 (-),score=77.01 GEZU01029574.1:194-916(-)
MLGRVLKRNTRAVVTTSRSISAALTKSQAPVSEIQIRGKHELPKLEYPVESGLPPCISGRQLDFHYNKHHKTYVDKLNDLLQGTTFEGHPLEKVIQRTAYNAENQAIFNNAAQHWNHSFYWRCMTPQPVEIPQELADALSAKWGSVDNFKKEFQTKALNLFGSGWTWLVWNGEELDLWNTSNAMTPVAENMVPLLTCDVWEHAYYLDHQNRRADYLAAFWKVVNWNFVYTNYMIATGQEE